MPPRAAQLVPLLAGVAAGAAYVALTAGGPGRRVVAPAYALWQSAMWVLAACAIAALVSCVLTTVLVRRQGWPFQWRGVLLSATAAAWLTPLFLLLRMNSPWAALPALAITVTITWGLRSGAPAEASSHVRQILLALGASVLLHSGALALALDQAAPAAAGLGLAVLALRMRLLASPAHPGAGRPLRWSLRWSVNTVSLAVLLTAVCLTYNVLWRIGPGGGRPATATDLLSWLLAPRSAAGGEAGRGRFAGRREAQPGIILHLRKLTDLAVVPPQPRALDGSGWARGRALSEPVEIPFAGVYWFYRPPDLEPPADSLTMHGSPDLQRYLSTDRIPLIMEARQNLGRLIGLDCCRQVRIHMRNADSFRRSVTVELILVNTARPDKPSLSLGTSRLTTFRPRIWDGPQEPAPEVLTYVVPPGRALEEFDEFRVVFHLARVRADRSAKTAIEKFVLVPAGI